MSKLFNLNFQVNKIRSSQKLKIHLKLAEPNDAEEITDLFKEVYRGTYPYKEMEDAQEIQRKITNLESEWLIFKSEQEEPVGCFGADLNLESKIGLLHGFLIRKKFQNVVDSLKSFIGSLIYFWSKYKNRILIWHAETRTKDSTAQFGTSLYGLKPIAFLPNKDFFFNRIESDFMAIIYDYTLLTKYRIKKDPKIIREVLKSYTYSNDRYHLGTPIIENPDIKVDKEKLNYIKNNSIFKTKQEKYNNTRFIFSLNNSDSYFTFNYNPYSRNCEKASYKVNNLEELVFFLDKVNELIKKSDINYFECFVSSYYPTHQKIFYNAGFKAMGYIPCWQYNNEEKNFEDCILFNYFKGPLNTNIKLIPESKKLLEYLNFYENNLLKESFNSIIS